MIVADCGRLGMSVHVVAYSPVRRSFVKVCHGILSARELGLRIALLVGRSELQFLRKSPWPALVQDTCITFLKASQCELSDIQGAQPLPERDQPCISGRTTPHQPPLRPFNPPTQYYITTHPRRQTRRSILFNQGRPSLTASPSLPRAQLLNKHSQNKDV